MSALSSFAPRGAFALSLLSVVAGILALVVLATGGVAAANGGVPSARSIQGEVTPRRDSDGHRSAYSDALTVDLDEIADGASLTPPRSAGIARPSGPTLLASCAIDEGRPGIEGSLPERPPRG